MRKLLIFVLLVAGMLFLPIDLRSNSALVIDEQKEINFTYEATIIDVIDVDIKRFGFLYIAAVKIFAECNVMFDLICRLGKELPEA